MESMHHRWFLVIHRSRHAFLRERFGGLDIEPRLLPLLRRLYGSERLRQEDLSAESGLDKSTIARAVRRVIDLGYVTRVPCLEDRRAYHLMLTEKARMLIPELDAAMDEWAAGVTAGFSDEELRQLDGYLRRMADGAEKLAGSGRNSRH